MQTGNTAKLDVLVFASHPDDAELSCAGTICKLTKSGKKVGVIDLTRGELGTRGDAETRDKEGKEAAKIMKLSDRKNMQFRDGFFANDEQHQLALIKMIRLYRPAIVLANALEDRHPDHGKGAKLVQDACFLSGLRKIETETDGKKQEAFRPARVFHYIQDRYLHPSFVVDITDTFDLKIQAIKAFRSQFYDPQSKEPQTYISSPDFLDFIEARAREMGHKIGVEFGEGFVSVNPLKVDEMMGLV